jgi:hypothetical protein
LGKNSKSRRALLNQIVEDLANIKELRLNNCLFRAVKLRTFFLHIYFENHKLLGFALVDDTHNLITEKFTVHLWPIFLQFVLINVNHDS